MESMTPFYQQCIKTFLTQYQSLQTEGTEIELLYDDERMQLHGTPRGMGQSEAYLSVFAPY